MIRDLPIQFIFCLHLLHGMASGNCVFAAVSGGRNFLINSRRRYFPLNWTQTRVEGRRKHHRSKIRSNLFFQQVFKSSGSRLTVASDFLHMMNSVIPTLDCCILKCCIAFNLWFAFKGMTPTAENSSIFSAASLRVFVSSSLCFVQHKYEQRECFVWIVSQAAAAAESKEC